MERQSDEALHSLAFSNYGHFTTMLVEDGGVRGLSLHLRRLENDCRSLFAHSISSDEIRGALCRAVHRIERPFVLRVTVTDPSITIGHVLSDTQPQVVTTVRAIRPPPTAGLSACTVDARREMVSVKHVGLFATIRLKRQAQQSGFDDFIYAPGGLIAEGSTWNVVFAQQNGLCWPRADALRGVTEQLIRQHVDAVHDFVPVSAINADTEAYALNSTFGVTPLRSINGHAFRLSDFVHLAPLREALSLAPVEPL